eukprot:1161421-Pelagomonas_calceolata.AAC.12
MELKVSEKHAVQPYMAAQQRIKKFEKKLVHEHDMLWLSEVHGIPDVRHFCYLRHFLGVKGTDTTWPVLRDCGQEPLQTRWCRASVNDLNGVLDSNSEVFRQVLRAENAECFQDSQTGFHLGDLRYRRQKVWRGTDALSPREMNRKAVTCHHWCRKPMNHTARAPFCISSYLFKDLDKEFMRNVSRLRLHAHCLKFESYKWLGGSNVCYECECAKVQDEEQALFYCNCYEMFHQQPISQSQQRADPLQASPAADQPESAAG